MGAIAHPFWKWSVVVVLVNQSIGSPFGRKDLFDLCCCCIIVLTCQPRRSTSAWKQGLFSFFSHFPPSFPKSFIWYGTELSTSTGISHFSILHKSSSHRHSMQCFSPELHRVWRRICRASWEDGGTSCQRYTTTAELIYWTHKEKEYIYCYISNIL